MATLVERYRSSSNSRTMDDTIDEEVISAGATITVEFRWAIFILLCTGVWVEMKVVEWVSANLPKSCFSRPCVRACLLPTCYVTISNRERSKEELCTENTAGSRRDEWRRYTWRTWKMLRANFNRAIFCTFLIPIMYRIDNTGFTVTCGGTAVVARKRCSEESRNMRFRWMDPKLVSAKIRFVYFS